MIDIIKLKSKIKIEDIIGKYIKLDYKNDNNLKACCPFHSEDTASFLIETKLQFFICFGCGCKGDVIKFIALYHNISYIEAYNILAKEAGLAPDNDLDLLKEISEYYQNKIQEIKPFLERRNITQKIIEEWNLGYTGDIFNLGNRFKESIDMLEDFRLVNIKNKNTPAEMITSVLYDRMSIPIENRIGVIGFSGRTISDHPIKYKNTPDNRYYSKLNSIFGIHKATQAIKDFDYTIIVEGYLDVIRMHEHDYKNTIGTQGLSLSKHVIRNLKNLSNKVILLYDGDIAGRKALKRNIPELIRNGVLFKVLLLPDKADPDSYLLNNSDLNSLELIDGLKIIKDLFNKEEINKILLDVSDNSLIDQRILSLYKINLDVFYKKPQHSNFKHREIIKFSKWTYLALLLEEFPQFYERINENDLDLVEEERLKNYFYQLNLYNLYKKCKNPEKIFNKLLKN